ncbi:MAG TPA: OpgC domain-containing protein [Rubellimicrobium sp.]|nr:OpgC domain-containing protein [Rubellimicrobium sp.]
MREMSPPVTGPVAPVALPPAARPRSTRDPRLDVLRGAALVTIFVNHVPGNFYESLTIRNWGFSDAAEAFVLMSGVSAGIAYGPAFRPGGDVWAGLARVWGRAWTLYLVHLLVTVAALAIAAGLALWADTPGLLSKDGIDALFLQPLQTLVAVPLLVHQLGYANILPLYMVLLFTAPGLLWLGWRWPGFLLAGSLALWLLSGELRINVPTWPVAGGWQFSPTSWQILFLLGLLAGIRMREGRRLVPMSRWLIVACGAFLLLALVWRTVPVVGDAMNHALWQLDQAGLPWILTAHQKVWETAPRLLHALALAYLLSAIPLVRRLCASRVAAPLALLGRHSLPVFALGSVIAFLFQGIKTRTGEDLLLDTLMLAAGLALQLGLAWSKDNWPSRRG